MACVLASDSKLAIMRRNVRYAGDGHLDHPTQIPWDVEPLLYLRPFLDLVRSEEAGAHATGAALPSLHKILPLDLAGSDAPNVAQDTAAVVEGFTGCRFEFTDLPSEEAVLAMARVLQVLLPARHRG